ncbi:MAG: hypothetical protein KDE53_26125 [Caldilineaceae bacterium]|nr:hypothetical protein [Caldilineaceae bacterium]
MRVHPVLGDWQIPRISGVASAEQRRFVEFPVPGRVGSLFQDMNNAPTRLVIVGSLFGDEVRDEFLETVREQFQAGEAVTFVADILTATEVQYVLIEELHFAESGAQPDQIDYRIVLKESPPPPPPPDPLGGLDAGLLDQAGNFLDSVTGALDVLDALGNVPDFSNPTPPLTGALDGITSATSDLENVLTPLNDIFGSDE